ncbi:hypothetical protein ACLGI4_09995 [Streptomyces sp. HMX112]|uniref:hypothetical protein n=1 Tax=Streptomyces sp. HMX112 TaxID=3390850 RepID=UPI003A80C7B5
MSDAEAYAVALKQFATDLNELHSARGAPSLQTLVDLSKVPPGRALSKSTISEALNGKRLPSVDVTLRIVQLLTVGDPPHRQQRIRAEWRTRWPQVKHLQKLSRTPRGRRGVPLPPPRPAQNDTARLGSTPNGAERYGTALPHPLPFYFFLSGYAVVWSIHDRTDRDCFQLPERTWYQVVGLGPGDGWIVGTAPPARFQILGLMLHGTVPPEATRPYLPGQP